MSNKRLLAIPCLAMAIIMLPALQASEASLVEAITLCQQEQDTLLRLRCYDAIEIIRSEPEPQQPAATPQPPPAKAPAHRPAPAAESAVVAEERFGQPQKPEANEPDRIYSMVNKIEKDARGHLVITFENGHIWRQNSSEYYPIKLGEEHYIRRAMLGSFILSKDNSNRTTRVRRIN